jgi:hypothetical protein
MAKRKNKWTEEKIARYMNEGRGSGEISNYKPWLTNQDFPSEGRTHRIKGWKTNRQHQLFSDLERNYFYILEWSENVIDIREQYPLNREITTKIADKKQINHPSDKENQTPIVMTTDFLITLRDNTGIKFIARTIKPAEKLNDKRVIEKLEIERQYWEDENVSWGIVSELDMPNNLWRNIQLMHHNFHLEEDEILLAETLYNYLALQKGQLLNALNIFDFNYSLETGSSLALFKHLVAKKIISLDMMEKINLRMNIDNLNFNEWPNREGALNGSIS